MTYKNFSSNLKHETLQQDETKSEAYTDGGLYNTHARSKPLPCLPGLRDRKHCPLLIATGDGGVGDESRGMAPWRYLEAASVLQSNLDRPFFF